MSLAAGTRLGPYQVLALLGAGGMGEVYRARDERLGRDVAVKVLAGSVASDSDRLRRLEQEARATAALNHPGIVAIHDIGCHDGVHYIVSELVEGATLRSLIAARALTPRAALRIATQVADALAAAHASGVVHRDLKPENLMVAGDERVKILDFGLAKMSPVPTLGEDTATAEETGTAPGTVLGTLGYMAPEQVRGDPLDHRADIFALGVVLYEMLAGYRPFRGATGAEVMTAILRDEPEDLSSSIRAPGGLSRLLSRCLAKKPEERFQMARDLAFALEVLTDAESGPIPSNPSAVTLSRLPEFRRISFRRGSIVAARYAPDGQTILYGAAWDGNPVEVYSSRLDGPESRPLGVPGATLLAVSGSGEMALCTGYRTIGIQLGVGTLARMSVMGSVPREVLEEVSAADFTPDGRQLAMVRRCQGRDRLELPTGRVLFQTSGAITHPRIAPGGDMVAFLHHPWQLDTAGVVAMVPVAGGEPRTLSSGWADIAGLAWRPNGEEIWFTGTRVGWSRALHAVTRGGRERLLARVAGDMTIQDVDRTGRPLVTHAFDRFGILARGPGDALERDLSWLDGSGPADLSADGRSLLFLEGGEAAGPDYSTYLRGTNGAPAVRLGDGVPLALSPNGQWAAAVLPAAHRLVLLPTRAGEARTLTEEELHYHVVGGWCADQRRFFFSAASNGEAARSYVCDIGTQRIEPLTEPGIEALTMSPDGRRLVATTTDGSIVMAPCPSGVAVPVPGLMAGEIVIRWSGDGRHLFTYRPGDVPLIVRRVELENGNVEAWRELGPPDRAGMDLIDRVRFTPDGACHAYRYRRSLSELFVVDGIV